MPGLTGIFASLNDARVKARGKLAEFANLVGGAHEGGLMDPNARMHEDVSRNLTYGLGQRLPPQMAANVADLGGLLNEAATGSLQALAGNDFFSSGGFDAGDVTANRAGQDAALRLLRGNARPTLASIFTPAPPKGIAGAVQRGVQDGTGWTGADTIAQGLELLLTKLFEQGNR